MTAAAVAVALAVGLLAARMALDLPQQRPAEKVVAVPAQSPPPAAAVAPAAPAAPANATAGADSEATAPGSTTAQAAAPGVEVVPEGENPTLLGEIRQSVGHAAGLNRVPDPLRLSASAAYAVDVNTGQVLVQKNQDAVLPIASLTKMMTGLLIVEAKLPMDEVLSITKEDVDNERHSRSRLRVGTTLTRKQALHLALMSSENRAAHALGRTFPGGMAQFVNAMNNRARQLGMQSTTYVDPTGLSSKNQSTAHDLVLLATVASKQPLLREFTTTPRLQVAFGNRTLQYNNSNRLVKNPKWDIGFQKTGYIIEAGMCMTVRTRIGGHDVLMVLLDAGDKHSRLADAERVKHWVVAQSGEHQAAAPARQASRT